MYKNIGKVKYIIIHQLQSGIYRQAMWSFPNILKDVGNIHYDILSKKNNIKQLYTWWSYLKVGRKRRKWTGLFILKKKE
jgi:hypothetical protein